MQEGGKSVCRHFLSYFEKDYRSLVFVEKGHSAVLCSVLYSIVFLVVFMENSKFMYPLHHIAVILVMLLSKGTFS